MWPICRPPRSVLWHARSSARWRIPIWVRRFCWCLRASWFPGIVDRAYVDQSHGWFHHDAATRYRQFPSAGWFRTSEGPFYLVVEPHTGTCYINREPDVARKLIDSDERLPLTLEEDLLLLRSIRSGCWRRTVSICWDRVPRMVASQVFG